MQYADLRDFIAQLEKLGELRRVAVEIDPVLAGRLPQTIRDAYNDAHQDTPSSDEPP